VGVDLLAESPARRIQLMNLPIISRMWSISHFPRIPGNIGNANSYNVPARYNVVKGAQTDKIMGDEPDLNMEQLFIQAAQELERQIV
jgi:hypothetical protein